MAEKNSPKLTPFEKEQIEVAKKILEFKLGAEANVVSIIYKNPDELFNTNLVLDDFSNNVWKVYFQIAYDIIVIEKKNVLDDITVGLYLEKHPKLRAKYKEYGEFETIQSDIFDHLLAMASEFGLKLYQLSAEIPRLRSE